MNFEKIDQQALDLALKFKKCEAELLNIFIQVDRFKIYRKRGYNSLFQYAVERLKISESHAYGFINVARKAHEIPQLNESIKSGKLSISKARRITSVLTKTNQNHWLKLAETTSQKKIEREVALANPKASIIEKMTYVSQEKEPREKVQIKRNTLRVKLEVGLSEKTMIKLRRTQDLVSQKKRGSVNIETTLEHILDEYLRKNDPLEKAKRQKMNGKLKVDDSIKAQLSTTSPTKTENKSTVINNANDGLIFVRNVKSCPTLKHTKKRVEPAPNSKTQQSSRTVTGQKNTRRLALPAKLKHQVYLKDEGRCSSINTSGKRCCSRRFLEIHHIQPLSRGGLDEIDNLTLLCSGHHKAEHD